MTTGTASDQPVSPPGEIIAFVLAGRAVPVAAVIRAAFFRGDLEIHWDDLAMQAAGRNYAAANSLDPDLAALQAGADQFRYDRDLITTEETEAWFGKRRLDAHDFEAHLLGTYWKDALEGKVDPPADDFSLLDPEKEKQLTIGLFLNGSFTGLARALAWRMASRRNGAPVDGALTERIEAQRGGFLSRFEIEPDGVAAWLEGAGLDSSWLEDLLSLEAAYESEIAAIVTPDRLTRALRSQRLALMRLEVEEIEFDTMEAAREAVLCVREDDLSMKEVAEESRYPHFERSYLLEELPQEWQMALFSTPENGLAGPFLEGDLVRLFRIQRKVEPAVTDEAVRVRLERHLVAAHFEELCAAQGLKSLWIKSQT